MGVLFPSVTLTTNNSAVTLNFRERKGAWCTLRRDVVTVWNTQGTRPSVRTSKCNIVTQRILVASKEKLFRIPIDCFCAMFDERII